MEYPIMKESMLKLDCLLQKLQGVFEENAFSWHAYVTDVQNCLLMDDMKAVHQHLSWMLRTTGEFRKGILEAQHELNVAEKNDK